MNSRDELHQLVDVEFPNLGLEGDTGEAIDRILGELRTVAHSIVDAVPAGHAFERALTLLREVAYNVKRGILSRED